MEIKRDRYLKRLISKRNNGLIKVITGIRRCGKSYLLFRLYYNYLISEGVARENIITIPLDDADYAGYRDPLALHERRQQRHEPQGQDDGRAHHLKEREAPARTIDGDVA